MFNFLFSIIILYFVNVLFIFIPTFDLMLILLKTNLNGNKSHFQNCCFNLIISRCKIAKYVTSHWVGGLRNVTTCDKDGGGVKKS